MKIKKFFDYVSKKLDPEKIFYPKYSSILKFVENTSISDIKDILDILKDEISPPEGQNWNIRYCIIASETSSKEIKHFGQKLAQPEDISILINLSEVFMDRFFTKNLEIYRIREWEKRCKDDNELLKFQISISVDSNLYSLFHEENNESRQAAIECCERIKDMCGFKSYYPHICPAVGGSGGFKDAKIILAFLF